jgi:hypothetical protein
MVRVWAAGLEPPVVYENVIDVGLGDRVGWLLTVRVTGTFSGLLPTPDAVMITLPVWVPAASPDVLTETDVDPDVVPLVGLTESQD